MGGGASQGSQAASHLGATERGARQALTHRSQSPRRARQRAAGTPLKAAVLAILCYLHSVLGGTSILHLCHSKITPGSLSEHIVCMN